MAKYYGKIGYAETVEVKPGAWKEVITERKYYAEVTRNTRRLQSTDRINDDIIVNNTFSIVADPYAKDNFHKIRYAEFMGAKWKVSNVEVLYPRLLLTLGGPYNG